MSGFLHQVGTFEARILQQTAPLGTSGRIHALRLRRRFQQPLSTRTQSSAAASAVLEKDLETPSITSIQNEVRNKMRESFKAPVGSNGGGEAGLTINGQPIDTIEFTPHSDPSPTHPPLYRPSKLSKDRRHDQFFYDYSKLLQRDYSTPEERENMTIDPQLIASEIQKAIETADPLTALIVISKLTTLPSGALIEVSEEQFTQLLKMMDPEYFFAPYIRFDKHVTARNPFYDSFFQSWDAVDHPRTVFLRLMTRLIRARQASGRPISSADYNHTLHIRRVLGDVQEGPLKYMQKFSTLDTKSYNDIMGALVNGGIWAQSEQKLRKQITSRYWPRNDEDKKREQVNKGRVVYVFEEMSRRGVQPNEETMCLLMATFAREADTDGIKQIMESAWGINIYKFLALGEEGIGHDFALDSPMRPTGRLLETLAHVFGTNQDIPLALRLMDFVSRRYGLPIPLSAWEEILERTYTLSVYKKKDTPSPHSTSKEHPRKALPPTAVENLWRTMTSAPYNVSPNIHMYDKIIRSQIARQRFGRAEQLMEEGRALHKQKIKAYRKLLHQWNRVQRGPDKVGEKERRALDQAIWTAKMEHHRSRQYIRAWVKKLIYRRSANGYDINPELAQSSMSGVVERWELFLPKKVEYKVMTGFVSLKPDTRAANAERVRGFLGLHNLAAKEERGQMGKEEAKMTDEEWESLNAENDEL